MSSPKQRVFIVGSRLYLVLALLRQMYVKAVSSQLRHVHGHAAAIQGPRFAALGAGWPCERAVPLGKWAGFRVLRAQEPGAWLAGAASEAPGFLGNPTGLAHAYHL
jgi:hypothetical protein